MDDREREVATVRAELARLRSRFGVDPAAPPRLLGETSTSTGGNMEEDEAEFADAMAGCLSVGLPLDAAVAFWASGSLAWREEDTDDDKN